MEQVAFWDFAGCRSRDCMKMVCCKFTAKMFYTILLHVAWPTSIHGPLSHWKKSLWPLRFEFEYHHSTIAAKLWIMNMNFWIHTRQWSTKVAVLCSMLCSMLFHVATVSNVIARSLTWCLPTSYYMFVSLEQLCVCIWVSRERERDKESQCLKHSKEGGTAVETQYSPCCHTAAKLRLESPSAGPERNATYCTLIQQQS